MLSVGLIVYLESTVYSNASVIEAVVACIERSYSSSGDCSNIEHLIRGSFLRLINLWFV